MIRLVMNEIQSIRSKCYSILLISVLLIGILILSPTISSLINTYTHVRSSGTIVANEAHAKSGSVEDIQVAVDAVVTAGGGIVYIPAGTFTFEPRDSGLTDVNGRPCGVRFVVTTGGLSIFGAGINKTVLEMPLDDSAPDGTMFQATGGNETAREVGGWNAGGRLRISGITFKGRPNLNAPNSDRLIWLVSCKDFRVDHCSFYYAGDTAVAINDHFTQSGIYGGDPDRVSQGVVDHCDFFDLYKYPIGTNGYGVGIGRAMHYLWTVWDDNIWNVLGVYDKNIFIEDCYFRGVRHAVSASNGGVYVLRNSIIEDLLIAEAATTGHPNRGDYHGMRAHEIYNNTVRYTGTYGARFYGIHMEGGGGVVFNNTIDNLIHAFRFGSCEISGTRGDTHPRGHLGDMYVWGNIATNCGAVYHAFSNAPTGCPQPQENVEYFLYAPTGFAPYPYPHPLTIG